MPILNYSLENNTIYDVPMIWGTPIVSAPHVSPAGIFQSSVGTIIGYKLIETVQPTTLEIDFDDGGNAGPCFPISINTISNILEPVGTTILFGEYPRHQSHIAIPTTFTVLDTKSYLIDTVRTTTTYPFWS
jgi:hypothetical protein